MVTPTIPGEVFSITYGCLIIELIKDYENVEDVNSQLDKIGFNIGLRIADDFLSKNSSIGKCTDMRQLADVLARNALKTYLGVNGQVSSWNSAGDECSIVIDSNPLTEFVEVPEKYAGLKYSQVICGAIRGALEAMHMDVVVWLADDVPNSTELRLKFNRIIRENVPAGEDE
uniref:Trafficking protein particle complex subunit n=1 Tax=Rhabditophanes sp. KR3021 TaxID=114890 RepID=A0AC35U219_9BILA